MIRHEYAHYYVDVANLKKYIGHSKRETSHGTDWKWACKMVGAEPTRSHNAALFSNTRWSVADAKDAYNANDVAAFDILPFLDKWDQVPFDAETASKMSARIKDRDPEGYYEVGNEVLHPLKGFGIVIETMPCNYWMQKVCVQFEDRTECVFTTEEICKIVDGRVVSYRSWKH